MERDPMIKFRSTIRGLNKKGADRYQFYLSQEDAVVLIETLQANVANPKGVKLDIHVAKKEANGRTFDSAFGFVKGVMEGPAGSGGARTYTAQPKASPEDLTAKIEALKQAQLKG